MHLNVKAFRGQQPLPPVALQTSPLSSSWAPRSGQVLGYANITSLLAYYQRARKYGVNPYSATLQLNVVLQVNTTSGTYAPEPRPDKLTTSLYPLGRGGQKALCPLERSPRELHALGRRGLIVVVQKLTDR